MTTKEQSSAIIIMLIAIALVFVVNSLVTRHALKEIQVKIEETSNDLKLVSNNVGQVINSLQSSTQNIDTILNNIEHSKELLNELSARTTALTSKEKEKIETSINKLEQTTQQVQKDRQEAEKMIEILHNSVIQ